MRSFYQSRPCLRATDSVDDDPPTLLKLSDSLTGVGIEHRRITEIDTTDRHQTSVKVAHRWAEVANAQGKTWCGQDRTPATGGMVPGSYSHGTDAKRPTRRPVDRS